MYSILITDDEKIVIESLTYIIEKNFPDQVRLYTARSGSEALETASSNKIDILFMDINMPGLDGLETLNRLKQFNPEVIIIILSAFDRFQYAQEAINLGVYKYLTKPVNRNLIVQTIRSAMSSIDTERGKLTNDIKMHEQLHFVSPLVESDFIYSCIFSSDKTVDLSSYLEYFDIQNAAWFFCCIEIPHLDRTNGYDTYCKIRNILSSVGKCITGSFMLNRLAAFFPMEQNTIPERRIEEMRRISRGIFSKLAMQITSDVRIGVSSVETDMANTVAVYNEALCALNRTPDDGGLAFACDKTNTASDTEEIRDLTIKLLNRLRAGDTVGVHPLVSRYCDVLFERQPLEINKIKNTLFELLVNARNSVAETDPTYYNEAFDTAFSFLASTDEQKALEQFVQKRFSEYVAAISKSRTLRENPIVKKACTYIDTHMAENISLEQMAAYVKISPYYLSKLFKEEKGENFISYLTTQRLEKAKALLRDETLSIKEISADIGYNDQNYFSKLFRHKFGVTPTAYRTGTEKNDAYTAAPGQFEGQ